MIFSLTKSFIIGVMSYIMSGVWINWGNLPPTMKTPGVAYGLNAVMLLFWIVSFIISEIYRIKNEKG